MGHEMCGWCNCTPCECDLKDFGKKSKDNSMLDEKIMYELIVKSHLGNNDNLPVQILDWKNLSYDTKYLYFNDHFLKNLQNILHTGWIGVKFTKTNGEERNMVCTLKSNLLPAFKAKIEDKKLKIKPKDSIAVWSRDDEAWRSFRLDSIEEVWVLTPFVVR